MGIVLSALRVITCKREGCEGSVKPRNVFCSHSCAAIHNNGNRAQVLNCTECGVVMPHKVRKGTTPFCTNECRRAWKISQWLAGKWSGSEKTRLSRLIRDYLIEQANGKCQDGRSGCNGWGMVNPKSGKLALTIDHIDGNWQNNSPDNLRVMCPNCHALTETYGALNTGNGRGATRSRSY